MRLVVESHADPVLVTRKFVGCSHSSLCCHSCWKEIDNRDYGYNFYNFIYTSFVAMVSVQGRSPVAARHDRVIISPNNHHPTPYFAVSIRGAGGHGNRLRTKPLVVESRAKPLLTESVAVARIFLIRKVAGLKCFGYLCGNDNIWTYDYTN